MSTEAEIRGKRAQGSYSVKGGLVGGGGVFIIMECILRDLAPLVLKG